MRKVCCPECGTEFKPGSGTDGRAAKFRCRLRIFDKDQEEALADSDPEIVQSDDGTIELTGFMDIANYIAFTITEFHDKGPLRGVTAASVETALDSRARSALSRNKGVAKFWFKYDTPDTWAEADDHEPQYYVRLDMARIASPKGGAVV